MAWRYRKRVRIAPGVYINLSKSGVSTTIGPRGANINIGKNGTYLNTGIPGTGLYNRQKISGGNTQYSKSNFSSNPTRNTSDSKGCSGCLFAFIIAIAIFFVESLLYPNAEITSQSTATILFILPILAAVIFYIAFTHKKEVVVDDDDNIENTEPEPSKFVDNTEPVSNVEEVTKKHDPNMQFLSWKQDNFNLMQDEAVALYDFLKSATRSMKIRKEVDRMLGLTNDDGSPWPLDNKITMAMLLDAYRCYTGLGYEVDAGQEEELGLLLFTNQVTNPGWKLEYFMLNEYRKSIAPTTRNIYDTIITIEESCPIPKGQFFFQHVFENVDVERMSQYMVRLYRFASAIAKADDKITKEESEWLASLMKSKDLTTDGRPLSAIANDCKVRNNSVLRDLDPLTKDVARYVIEENTASASMIQRHFRIGYNRSRIILDQLETLHIVGPANGSQPRVLLELDYSEELFSSERLSSFESKTETRSTAENQEENKTSYQEELNKLIGLAPVKEEVEKLANFIKIMKLREEKGLPVSNISYHCVFTGNPGTGKTTVARIVANIYKELGVLKKGHLVETDRSGLVAEYIGQTAVKTNKIIDSALDGVLFIDEAYSLVNGSSNDYGLEAIATLLKRMEDDRKRLVVILAGYSEEMKVFIDANPGLQSRFNRYINFPDYDSEELFDIYKKDLDKHQYELDSDAEKQVKAIIENAVMNKDSNFGNARFVRNLFEKTLENQATRLASEPKITSEMLCTIVQQDIPEV